MYEFCHSCDRTRWFENGICDYCKQPKHHIEAGNDPDLISKYVSEPTPGVKYWE